MRYPVFTVVAVSLLSSVLGGAFTFFFLSSVFSTSAERFLNAAKDGLTEQVINARLDELAADEQAAIAVVDRVTPSVVNLILQKPLSLLTAQERRLLEEQYGFPVLNDTEHADEPIDVGGGTGFFIRSDGLIVTNRHVIEGKDTRVLVAVEDGREFEARIVAVDSLLDIALIDIDGEGYPTAPLGRSNEIKIGQTVIAIGNSLTEFQNTVTKGVISGTDRRVITSDEQGDETLLDGALQTDAAINLGNSGGPLMTLRGEVIGVNTAVSGDGQSIGFAIPIDDVRRVVEDVERYGEIHRAWAGVRYVMIDPSSAAAYDAPSVTGALLLASPTVPAITPDGPAQQAGLKEGDVITHLNGEALNHRRHLTRALSVLHPEDTVNLTVRRQDETIQVSLKLTQKP